MRRGWPELLKTRTAFIMVGGFGIVEIRFCKRVVRGFGEGWLV